MGVFPLSFRSPDVGPSILLLTLFRDRRRETHFLLDSPRVDSSTLFSELSPISAKSLPYRNFTAAYAVPPASERSASLSTFFASGRVPQFPRTDEMTQRFKALVEPSLSAFYFMEQLPFAPCPGPRG